MASLEGAGQRLLIPLGSSASTGSPASAAGAAGSEPAGSASMGALRLEALEVAVTPVGWYVSTTGTLDILRLEATDAADAASPTAAWAHVPFDPSGAGWTWQRLDEQGQSAYIPPAGMPRRIEAGVGNTRSIVSQYADAPTVWRAWATTQPPGGASVPSAATGSSGPAPLAAIADDRLLALTGQSVGATLSASLQGVDLPLEIAGSAAAVPPLDPRQPFLVVDGPSLALAAFAAGSGPVPTSEWWITTDPGAEASVAAAVASAPFSAQVVDRAQVQRQLEGDPVAAGVIGALLMGAVAALLLAAIGFLISAAAAVDAREGELGLARAVGVSDGQLLGWLGSEQAVALVLGAVAGIVLGIAVAWVVLPVADFTPDGSRPVPEAALVVPWAALALMAAGALALLASAVMSVRGRLEALDAASVLREDRA